MPDPVNVTTTAATKTYLGITDGAFDARIDQLLPIIDAMFERHTGRQIVPARNIEEKVNGRGSPYLYVSRVPIIQVTELKLVNPSDGSVIQSYEPPGAANADAILGAAGKFTTGEWIELIQTGGSAAPETSSRWPFVFPIGTHNVHVKYDSGYEVIPPPMQLAAWLTINSMMRNRPNGMESERIGDYSYKRSTASEGAKAGLSPEAVGLLAPYKVHRIERATRPNQTGYERTART